MHSRLPQVMATVSLPQDKSTPLKGMRAVFATFGCKLNFAETATVASQLEALGVARAQKGERVALCVVNSCAVTLVAEQKCRQAIHRLEREHPGALMVVMGCYAQLQKRDAAPFPPHALIIPNDRKAQAAQLIAERLMGRAAQGSPCCGEQAEGQWQFAPACSKGDRTRWFLKVQDGCNYGCTYCTIPAARGRSRSPSVESLVSQAEAVAKAGGHEVVLTGVNIGDFGHDTGEGLLTLIKCLDEVEGIARYRISSIEPNLLTDEIISFVACSRAFMPHFHLPLQAGSDAVLRLMRRRYDASLFRHKVECIRDAMPHAFIGVDVMAGTRGETDEYFEQGFDFIAQLPVSQLHVFTYSERPGTAALHIPHRVSPAEKKRRTNRLIALSEEKRMGFYRQFIGHERMALLEHATPGKPLHGFTDNYLRVEVSEAGAQENNLVRVRMEKLNETGDALCATIVP